MRAFTRSGFRRALRRFGAAGVCVAYLIAALGIPLPASVHKDASQPFPCQDHPCGCQTAEQCWRNCCCFTPEERWAWARAHHVEPPAYAEKPTEKPTAGGWNTVKLRNCAKGKTESVAKSCCRTSTKRSSCCQTTSDRPAKQPPIKSGRVRWNTAAGRLAMSGRNDPVGQRRRCPACSPAAGVASRLASPCPPRASRTRSLARCPAPLSPSSTTVPRLILVDIACFPLVPTLRVGTHVRTLRVPSAHCA